MIKKFAAVVMMAVLTASAASGQTEGPAPGQPSVTVLDTQEVQGILGREIRSTADENMHRRLPRYRDADERRLQRQRDERVERQSQPFADNVHRQHGDAVRHAPHERTHVGRGAHGASRSTIQPRSSGR